MGKDEEEGKERHVVWKRRTKPCSDRWRTVGQQAKRAFLFSGRCPRNVNYVPYILQFYRQAVLRGMGCEMEIVWACGGEWFLAPYVGRKKRQLLTDHDQPTGLVFLQVRVQKRTEVTTTAHLQQHLSSLNNRNSLLPLSMWRSPPPSRPLW